MVAGAPVHPIALGCMNMSLGRRPDEATSVRTIRAALDVGVGLLDTADAYCPRDGPIGHNERLVARALRGRSTDRPLVATKGGHVRPGGRWELDGSPDHLRTACDASLRALGVDEIDLYQLHRPDPQIPLPESVGTLAELRDAGKIRHIGLCNVSVAQLREARRLAPIASVQNELSFLARQSYEAGEVAACAADGLAFLAWRPLGGRVGSGSLAARASAVRAAAERRGVSPHRLVLAWMIALAPVVIPVVGATRPETILDSVQAPEMVLQAEEMLALAGPKR